VAYVRPEVAELGVEVRSELCRAEVHAEVDVGGVGQKSLKELLMGARRFSGVPHGPFSP